MVLPLLNSVCRDNKVSRPGTSLSHFPFKSVVTEVVEDPPTVIHESVKFRRLHQKTTKLKEQETHVENTETAGHY